MFDTAVALKHTEGRRKWYKWVNLNELYHHAKFTFITLIVSVKIATLKFLPRRTTGRPTGPPDTDHCIDSYFSCESNKEEGRGFGTVYRRAHVKDPAAAENVVLAKFWKRIHHRQKWIGRLGKQREPVADGFPRRKQPEFSTGKTKFTQIQTRKSYKIRNIRWQNNRRQTCNNRENNVYSM